MSCLKDKETDEVPSSSAMHEPGYHDSRSKNRPDAAHEESNHNDTADSEPISKHLSPSKIIVVTIALCLAIFCLGLDNTVITTAIPKITDHFNALQDVGWYGSAYLITQCAFQLVYGKLYTIFNTKYIFLAAVLIFELGSVVCGAAPSSTSFIVGRAIAGLGAAGIFTGAVLILNNSVPMASLPVYIGILGMVFGSSSVAGPLIGGVFTENAKLTWRWCFYLNLPLGLITILVVLFLFKPRPTPNAELPLLIRLRRLDPLGTLLLLPAIICLTLALSWGGTQYAWKSGRVVACLVISVVLAVAFCLHQKLKGDTAIVPPNIVKNRNIYGSAFFTLALGGVYFTLVYYIPIWFQVVKEVSAMKSGIMNVPLICGTIIILFVAGIITTLTGWYIPFFYLSVIFMSVGTGLCTTWKVDSGASVWITDQLLAGIGVGFGLQQPVMVVQACLRPQDVPTGTAVVMFANAMGGAIMLSVGQNVFTNKVLQNVGAVTKAFDPRIILVTGATKLREIAPKEVYGAVVVAYSKALTDTFYVAVALSIISLFGAVFIEWKRIAGGKSISSVT